MDYSTLSRFMGIMPITVTHLCIASYTFISPTAANGYGVQPLPVVKSKAPGNIPKYTEGGLVYF
ncbi:hypothetical protein D0962_15340 [Leptolyngbyaceae cyanobacterium CCMR0082]|uniref:Uncharacterized protein n=1 Tax=Adonisia turfae CCMR0082 TaxID=2304604 RepID=A0A6M0S6Q6_9CYAN|nr:hypothetical protein [Adonisia turfae]NEZ64147.1 hypothetical protein [Adonisia turfae CCMR0082]